MQGESVTTEFKYFAFISYSSKDRVWGKWLHRDIEHYGTPRSLIGRDSRDGKVPKRLFPVFWDRAELPSSASLGDNINNALRQSRYLIVICSPHAAASHWVNKEIAYFKSLGREDHVLGFIIGGEPNATNKPESGQLECFPPALRFQLDAAGNLTKTRTEPIAADARPHGDGKRNAKLKLLAGLLAVNYDDLAQREKWRVFWRRLRYAALASATITAALWWWLQPGYARISLRPNPPPPGLQLTIDGRAASFNSPSQQFKLSAGTHTFRFAAPDYMEVIKYVSFPRFSRGEINNENLFELVHESGVLDVEAGPEGAQIEVDSKPFGSRIEQLPFNTGRHSVRAALDGYYERAQAVDLQKDQTNMVYLSLDTAQNSWSIQRPDVQGIFANVGDVDGDGVDDFAHNFGSGVGIVSGASGKIIRQFHAWASAVTACDLGGKVGRVVLSCSTENEIELLCIRPDRDQPLWTWTGPRPPWGSASATVVGDQNGDGVAELIVAGVGNEMFLVDGATGKTIATMRFPVTQWGDGPLIRRCHTPSGEGLLFCGPLAGPPGSSPTENTFCAGLLLLKNGSLIWHKNFSGVIGSLHLCEIEGQGQPDIAMVTKDKWIVCDSSNGNIKYEGSLPGHRTGDELLQFLFADTDGDGVAEWIMDFRDNASDPHPLITAIRLRDNYPRWARTNLFPMVQQCLQDDSLLERFDTPQGSDLLARTDDGGLLLRVENAVVCLDPDKGGTRWQLPIATGDTHSFISHVNGKPELFLGEMSETGRGGVRCLGMNGQPIWGVSFGREYSPMLVLADANHTNRSYLILNAHIGTESDVCEILCVSVPGSGDWTRRVIQPTPPPGSPYASVPCVIVVGGRGLVAELKETSRGEPDLFCFDTGSGVKLWNARELFETAYGRYDANSSAGQSEAAPACGIWNGTSAIALIGHGQPTINGTRTELFVYRAENGEKMAEVPIDPQTDAHAASILADVDGDGQTDFVVARPIVNGDYTGGSGDVVAVGGAQRRQIWEQKLIRPCALAVVKLANEKSARILVTLHSGSLCALRGSDGAVLWTNSTHVWNGAAAVAMVDDSPEIFAVDTSGVVQILDPSTGAAKKSSTIEPSVHSLGPVVISADEKTALFACDSAGVVALDAEALHEKWRALSGDSVSVPPLVADVNGDGHAEVIACTDSGHVIIVDLESGAMLSDDLLPGANAAQSAPDGELAFLPKSNGRPAKLFVTCKDGILRSKTLVLKNY